MKGFLLALVVIVIAIGALGLWRGWFEVGGKKGEGKVQASLNVDVNKFKEDKDRFKKALSERSKSLKDKLNQSQGQGQRLNRRRQVQSRKGNRVPNQEARDNRKQDEGGRRHHRGEFQNPERISYGR